MQPGDDSLSLDDDAQPHGRKRGRIYHLRRKHADGIKGRPALRSKPPRPDQFYASTVCITCLLSVLSFAFFLYYFERDVSPGIREVWSVRSAKCMVDRVKVADSSFVVVDATAQTAGLVRCRPADTLADHYGICMQVWVNYSVGGNSGPEPCKVSLTSLSKLDTTVGASDLLPMDVADFNYLPLAREDEPTPRFAIDYLNEVANIGPTRVFPDQATGLGYGAYLGCSLVDCRPTQEEARNASRTLLQLYPPGIEFDCYVLRGKASFKQIQHTYLDILEREHDKRVPVFYYKQYTAVHVLLLGIGLFATSSVCCSCCLFLLCREWCCQFEWGRKFQHF